MQDQSTDKVILIARMIAHELGTKLPLDLINLLGQHETIFAEMEHTQKWLKLAKEHIKDRYSLEGDHSKISDFLASQIYIMDLLTIFLGKKDGKVFIQLVAGDILSTILDIEKSNNNFKKHNKLTPLSKALKGYEHCHIELFPVNRLQMYSKPKNAETLKRVISYQIRNKEKLDVKSALDTVDGEVLRSTNNQGRRSTGSWLISKQTEKGRIYLCASLHPNNHSFINDDYALKIIRVAERLL